MFVTRFSFQSHETKWFQKLASFYPKGCSVDAVPAHHWDSVSFLKRAASQTAKYGKTRRDLECAKAIFPCEMFSKKGKTFRFHLPSAGDRVVTKYMSKNCAKDLRPFGYQYKLAKLNCRVWWIPPKGSNQWQLLFTGHIFQFPFHIFFQKSVY